MSLAVWLTTNGHGQTLDVLMEDKSCIDTIILASELQLLDSLIQDNHLL